MLTLPDATVQFSTVLNIMGVLIDSELTMANHTAGSGVTPNGQMPGASGI